MNKETHANIGEVVHEVLYPLTYPPKLIFAYKHSTPGNEIMGVAIDAETGAILQAAILPTKQRVMLALGIGNEDAHAHNYYRVFGGKHGYKLIWIDNPDTDPRTASLKGKLITKAEELIEASQEEAGDNSAAELTEQIVKQAVEAPNDDKAKGFF